MADRHVERDSRPAELLRFGDGGKLGCGGTLGRRVIQSLTGIERFAAPDADSTCSDRDDRNGNIMQSDNRMVFGLGQRLSQRPEKVQNYLSWLQEFCETEFFN